MDTGAWTELFAVWVTTGAATAGADASRSDRPDSASARAAVSFQMYEYNT